MKLKLTLISILIIALSSSCKQNNKSGKTILKDKRPIVAFSIYPIYDMAKNIAGDKVKLLYIIPTGANPHTFSPTPSLVKKLASVDLFIGVNPFFDGWITKFLKKDTKKYFLSYGKKNPHIWLSLNGAVNISGKIFKHIKILDKKNKKFYKKNYERYTIKLGELKEKISDMFKAVPKTNRSFIQFHPAWTKFADENNLNAIASIEEGHGDVPSIRKIKKLISIAKNNKIKVVVIGINDQHKFVDNFIKEIKGKKIKLDTIGNKKNKKTASYYNLMLYNAKKLADSLK